MSPITVSRASVAVTSPSDPAVGHGERELLALGLEPVDDVADARARGDGHRRRRHVLPVPLLGPDLLDGQCELDGDEEPGRRDERETSE